MSEAGAVAALLERYAAAVRAKDVEAFLSLYDAQVRVFDLWGTWLYPDAAAWRGAVVDWFDSLGDEQVAVAWHDVAVVPSAEVAAMSAFVTYRGLAPDGSPRRAMDNRLSWVVHRGTDGEWRIVHEHTSAPADLATNRVVLTR